MTASSFAPGAVICDRYRLEEQIGQGAFGAVFRATQLALGRAVALKVLLQDAMDDDGSERFQREAALVQRLDHPNVVRLLDFGRAADTSPFLVFELLHGQTLAEAGDAGPMPAARVARIAAQILKALMEAHAHAIVHRDLKPANVFLCNFDGEPDFVKLLDFGMAKAAHARGLTRRGAVIGTPAYMSPEQVMGDEATFASDLYALGLTLSELLAGRPIYGDLPAIGVAHQQLSPEPVPHAPEVLASPLGAIVQRATQKLPERRYASAAEMLAHVASAMGIATASDGAARAVTEAPVALAYAPTHPLSPAAFTPRASPLVPPAPARSPRRSASRWVLPAVVAGGSAVCGGALALALTVGRIADDGRSPPGSAPKAAPARGNARSFGHVQLRQLTAEMIIERVEAAGYELLPDSVTNRQVGGTSMVTLAVRKSSRSATVMLHGNSSVEDARMYERVYAEDDSVAVLREDDHVLVVFAQNGTERGNGPSRKLMQAIVR